MNDSPRSCIGCVYWAPRSPTKGTCRHHAPAAIVGPDAGPDGATALWPTTLGGDWCGDWQPRDTPLVDQEPPMDTEEERALRNASIAEALLILPAERRDKLLLDVLTEEERACPTPPDDFYERVQQYLARIRDDRTG